MVKITDSVIRDPFSLARLFCKKQKSASQRDHLTHDTCYF